tara:strand:+ start:1515 stop:1694 length:180 start_codon:yes stop_codon:yes gene_type:complete
VKVGDLVRHREETCGFGVIVDVNLALSDVFVRWFSSDPDCTDMMGWHIPDEIQVVSECK